MNENGLPFETAQRIPVIRETKLLNLQYSFAKDEDGGVFLNLDLVLGGCAERYVVVFDADGWDRFTTAAQNAGSQVVIAKPRIVP